MESNVINSTSYPISKIKKIKNKTGMVNNFTKQDYTINCMLDKRSTTGSGTVMVNYAFGE